MEIFWLSEKTHRQHKSSLSKGDSIYFIGSISTRADLSIVEHHNHHKVTATCNLSLYCSAEQIKIICADSSAFTFHTLTFWTEQIKYEIMACAHAIYNTSHGTAGARETKTLIASVTGGNGLP